MRFGQFLRSGLVTVSLFLAFDTLPNGITLGANAASHQGFGAGTPGGEGQAVYHVTNLNDSGQGSLRDAVSQGNRHIVFDVGGEILLGAKLAVRGAFITIDGFTAPSPGITLKNAGLNISGNKGAHDVIVQGIRVRGSSEDGIQIVEGAYNVVIDHVSIQGSADGNLDIGTGTHDVTISWSIFAEPAGDEKNMLIKYNPSRITLHHNMFLNAKQRNPQVRIDDAGTLARDTTLDMRNNLVWGWQGGYGTLIWYGPWANVADNFYSAAGGDPETALRVSDGARVFAAGNFSQDGLTSYINGQGTEPVPFQAPLVDTTDACTAAHLLLSDAGVKPRDAVDQQYLSAISLPSCAEVDPTIVFSPNRLDFSATIAGSNPTPKTLTVTDSSGVGLSWTVSTGATWLSPSPVSGTTPSNVTVAVNLSGLPVGSYLGSITIAASDALNSPVLIPVTLAVSPAVTTPEITTPTPGSVLPGSSVTFRWRSNGVKVKNWQLYVGASRGAKNLYDSGKLDASKTSRTVSGLPTDGRTIWAQLRFEISEKWQFVDFQYTAALK